MNVLKKILWRLLLVFSVTVAAMILLDILYWLLFADLSVTLLF
jgi:hypothetical protein